jgi:transposase
MNETARMSRIRLTDHQWAFIRPLVPPPAHTGRPRADDRWTIDGILYIVITGCRWHHLPREYGAPTTHWLRLIVPAPVADKQVVNPRYPKL